MTKITKNDVKKLGVLARLSVPGGAAEKLASELKSILDYDAKLQSVDVKNVESTDQVTGMIDVWREDKAVPSAISRDELLANTPDTKDGYIKVKRVIQ